MDFSWGVLVGSIVAPVVGVTAYVHKTFSTKGEVKDAAKHLKALNDAQHEVIVTKLDHLHSCVHELKEVIKENMEWKS